MNVSEKSTTSVMEMQGGNPLVNWYKKQLNYFDKHVFAMMSMYMIIQSCLGSIASMFVIFNNGNDFYMILSVSLAMGCNAMLLAQAGAKLAVGSFYLSIIVNAIILIMHL